MAVNSRVSIDLVIPNQSPPQGMALAQATLCGHVPNHGGLVIPVTLDVTSVIDVPPHTRIFVLQWILVTIGHFLFMNTLALTGR